jgi:hypothetical protein
MMCLTFQKVQTNNTIPFVDTGGILCSWFAQILVSFHHTGQLEATKQLSLEFLDVLCVVDPTIESKAAIIFMLCGTTSLEWCKCDIQVVNAFSSQAVDIITNVQQQFKTAEMEISQQIQIKHNPRKTPKKCACVQIMFIIRI